MVEEGPGSPINQPLLSNPTKHAILHACMALSPVGIKLPGSGTLRIEQFCSEILNAIQCSKSTKKKKKPRLSELRLLPEVEVLKFYEGASSFKEFAEVVCEYLSYHVEEELFDTVPNVKEICWKVYSECQKFNITYPKWLVGDSTYSLWLVFCSLLSSFSEHIDPESLTDILIRIYKLSGYSWNESYDLIPSEPIDFPVFLECLTKCFTTLDLHPTVVTEMICDLKDEIVSGVLKKGYLEKKGHKAPTIKRRWFVLTRNCLIYYVSRDKLVEKGRLVLNPTTNVEILPDKSDKKHRFLVTCGKSGKEYEMYADDNRSRNEWMLDIGKAIQLENALRQNNEEDFSQSMGHFYRLRYGTASPHLDRADSLLKRLTHSCTPDLKERMHRATLGKSMILSPKARFPTFDGAGVCRSYTVGNANTGNAACTSTDEDEVIPPGPDDVYVEMDGKETDIDKNDTGNVDGKSSDDEDGYTFMFRGTMDKNNKLMLDLNVEEKEEEAEKERRESNSSSSHDDKGSTNISKHPSASDAYETMEPSFLKNSPKRHSKEIDQHSPLMKKDSKGSQQNSPTVSHSPIKLSNANQYLKLSELDQLEEIQQRHHSVQDNQLFDDEKYTKTMPQKRDSSAPLPPPRPLETLSSSKSLFSEFRSATFTEPNGSRHSGGSSDSHPVPPPRPIETFTISSSLPPSAHLMSSEELDRVAPGDFTIPENSDDFSLNTPPPIPARDRHLESKNSSHSIHSLSSSSLQSTPIEIRLPPYSTEEDRNSEHELYYVMPNSLN